MEGLITKNASKSIQTFFISLKRLLINNVATIVAGEADKFRNNDIDSNEDGDEPNARHSAHPRNTLATLAFTTLARNLLRTGLELGKDSLDPMRLLMRLSMSLINSQNTSF